MLINCNINVIKDKEIGRERNTINGDIEKSVSSINHLSDPLIAVFDLTRNALENIFPAR